MEITNPYMKNYPVSLHNNEPEFPQMINIVLSCSLLIFFSCCVTFCLVFFFYKYFHDISTLNYLYHIFFFFGSYSSNSSVFKISNVLVNAIVTSKRKMTERDECVYRNMTIEFFEFSLVVTSTVFSRQSLGTDHPSLQLTHWKPNLHSIV